MRQGNPAANTGNKRRRQRRKKMNGAGSLSLTREKAGHGENTWPSRIEIDAGRVATWTLIFTNTFFVSYFFAKLFQLV
jgi:hypothetical protein